jgi:FkbM family methyltransferase
MTGSVRSPRKIVRRMRLLPLARRELRDWPRFMAAYGLGLVPRKPYEFRSGILLRIGRAVEHVPIIEVFLRRDYGDIPAGATVLDLGASTGVFAVYAASAPESRVVAYEPMPSSYELLVENVERNGANVVCRHAAVTGSGGEAQLYVGGGGLLFPSLVAPAADARSLTVPAVTLDEIMGRHDLGTVDLLKLDIEGAEYDVLYTASPDCLARVAEIRMEVHRLDGEDRNAAALERYLIDAGYRITLRRHEPSGVVVLWAAH